MYGLKKFWLILCCAFCGIQLFVDVAVAKLKLTLSGNYPEIEVANGILRGKWATARSGRSFASFEGIPYGQVPRRFDAPQTPQNWTGVKNGVTPGTPCPQFDPYSKSFVDGDENCLFVNVYMPMNENLTDTAAPNLPIMFFIHGGAFMNGAGSQWGPNYFMSENVILITVNYRLGNFGFLKFGKEIPGNNGLKDLIMALKWVQKNAKYVNGDSQRVTIFGGSAGAVATQALLITPAKEAQGLFHAAISQSGSMLLPWALQTKSEELALDFAKILNCDSFSNSKQIVDCLRSKSVRNLIEAELQLAVIWLYEQFSKSPSKTINSRGLFPTFPFVPSIDLLYASSKDGDFSVLPDLPENLITLYKNNSADLPFIVGHNGNETLGNARTILGNLSLVTELNKNWDERIPQILPHLSESIEEQETAAHENHGHGSHQHGDHGDMNHVGERKREITRDIRNFYFDGHDISNQTLTNMANFFSDYFFDIGIRKMAILHANRGARVYAYVNNFVGKFSLVNLQNLTTEGTDHGDETQYLFPSTRNPKLWPDVEKDSVEEEFSKHIVSTWSTFAELGKTWDDNWPPIKVNEPQEPSDNPAIGWLSLDYKSRSLQVDGDDELERYEFWKKLLPKVTKGHDHVHHDTSKAVPLHLNLVIGLTAMYIHLSIF